MKNQFKTIVTALLLGSAIFANANTNPANPTVKNYALSMYKINGKSHYNVAIDKSAGSQVKILLKAANNAIVYDNNISKNETQFRTKLDLSNMENGKYLLIVTDGTNVESKEIEVANSSKNIENVKTFEIGFIHTKGSKIINVNIDKLEGAEVQVYLKDSAGNIVYEEIMEKSTQTLRAKYNLSKLERGTYKFEVSDGVQREVNVIEVK